MFYCNHLNKLCSTAWSKVASTKLQKYSWKWFHTEAKITLLHYKNEKKSYINPCCQDIQEHCSQCSRKLCQTISKEKCILAEKTVTNLNPDDVKNEEQIREKNNFPIFLNDQSCEVFQNTEQFVFSFYVKINRELSEEENLSFLRSQLESLDEIEVLTSIKFKRYFNRLLFNEIIIDFNTTKTELWKNEPRIILRKISCYNDAYKFSQLNYKKLYEN